MSLLDFNFLLRFSLVLLHNFFCSKNLLCPYSPTRNAFSHFKRLIETWEMSQFRYFSWVSFNACSNSWEISRSQKEFGIFQWFSILLDSFRTLYLAINNDEHFLDLLSFTYQSLLRDVTHLREDIQVFTQEKSAVLTKERDFRNEVNDV